MKDEFYYPDYDYDASANEQFEDEMSEIWGDYFESELEDFYEGKD